MERKIMQKLNVPIDWIENCNPVQPGLYFVASRYNKTGFGFYDYLNWDGEKWLKADSIKVVGWVSLADFLGMIDAGWPASDDSDKELEKSYHKNKEKFKGDEGGFYEVE
ncbi:hypothetical protein PESP_a3813 [Pseudoalteromonas espejiana DSM 9414]|uniref:Uncharacterized protein n=1 Tax=Pseudoalteromonas espejiana TaxID=28107 RepID=A0A510XTW0_9GAMM|nr:hypothetical protein [Pseudoalteromonas espejiana]ASM51568.1 hypothetical protein PESP_a3813 [Pseudoalteromonas espejiana DSM 9414]GEK54468.1 hypothetical protein PES01_13130 [Pseudoalteromonas espejiana]